MIPFSCRMPEVLQEPYIHFLYSVGTRIFTTATWHFKTIAELLEILFGMDTELEKEPNFSSFHELGQSPIRIINLLQSLMFNWADSLSLEPVDMQYLNQINLQSCIRKDASG